MYLVASIVTVTIVRTIFIFSQYLGNDRKSRKSPRGLRQECYYPYDRYPPDLPGPPGTDVYNMY